MDQGTSRTHDLMRKKAQEARHEAKGQMMAQRRFGLAKPNQKFPFEVILSECKSNKFSDITWLERLKNALANREANPDDFFKGQDGSFNLHCLTNVISGNAGDHSSQLLALRCAANLGPLSEKHGLQMARSIGPYLVTLLSSNSANIAEAAAVSL